MNYFAHAFPHLDRPYFLAGLAVPDWLSVVDRRCRVRRRTILTRLPELHGDAHELAAGILRHLDDDAWFHGSAPFFELTARIAQGFRSLASEEDQWRCGFLGHVVLELLLDSCLMEQFPDAIGVYYDQMAQLDPQQVARGVAELSTQPPEQLPELIQMYLRERFLEDYQDDLRLLRRLNQVLRRVGLTPLPIEVTAVLKVSRELVRSRWAELLPLDSFPESAVRPEPASRLSE